MLSFLFLSIYIYFHWIIFSLSLQIYLLQNQPNLLTMKNIFLSINYLLNFLPLTSIDNLLEIMSLLEKLHKNVKNHISILLYSMKILIILPQNH